MPSISACLIARDEEELLGACLASLRPFVDELCLVDTGSKDRTIELARSFGAKIAEVAWRDDFAAARNASLELATMDWILIVDADERLDPASAPLLQAALAGAAPGDLALLLMREDLSASGPSTGLSLPRLFRNRAGIRFNRPVHESIMESLFALGGGAPKACGARLIHLGYLPEQLRKQDKRERNLLILRKQFAAESGDLYNAYKLATSLHDDAAEERLRAFSSAAELVERLSAAEKLELPFLARLFDAHAAALAEAGRLSEAIALAGRGLVQFPGSGELLHRRGELARAVGDDETALALLERALEPREHSAVRADRPHDLLVRCAISLLAIDRVGPESLPGFPQLNDLAVRCAQVHRLLRQGEIYQATEALELLLVEAPKHDSVRLLSAELSWSLGEATTAEKLLRPISLRSSAGRRAGMLLSVLAFARGDLAALRGLPRDLPEAALATLFAERAGTRPGLDRAFDLPALQAEIGRWRMKLAR